MATNTVGDRLLSVACAALINEWLGQGYEETHVVRVSANKYFCTFEIGAEDETGYHPVSTCVATQMIGASDGVAEYLGGLENKTRNGQATDTPE